MKDTTILHALLKRYRTYEKLILKKILLSGYTINYLIINLFLVYFLTFYQTT